MVVRWPDDDHDTIEAPDAAALRSWFDANHDRADAVWIKYWKQGSGRPSVTWSEAVSAWSKVNREKVTALEASGRMTDAGRAVVERARADGSWTLLDAAEALIVPEDLRAAFDDHPGASEFYDTLAPSAKSSVLRKIYLSKRPATRAKWVEASARRLASGDKPPYT